MIELCDERHLIKAKSESSTTSTALLSGGIGRDRSDILDSANLEAISGKSSDGGLSTGSRNLLASTTSASQLDVDGVDANILEGFADIDSGEHS